MLHEFQKYTSHEFSVILLHFGANSRCITKTKSKVTFPFTLHGHVLEEVQSAKYLGVTISEDMSWNRQINKTTAKTNSKLGFLKRNIKVKDQAMKEKACKAVMRPTTEYCATVWDRHVEKQATGLEMVQQRAGGWVTGIYHNMSHVSDMLQDLGW